MTQSSSLKIAFIVPYTFLPPYNGGHQASIQFCRGVYAHTELVCLSTFGNEINRVSFPVQELFRDTKSKYIDLRVAARIGDFCRRERITHLVPTQPFMGLNLLPVVRRLGIQMVIFSHNIEYLRFGTLGKRWAVALRWFEHLIYRQATGVMFMSHYELQLARVEFGLGEQNSLFVPYGIDERASPRKETHLLARQEVATRHSLREDALWLIYFGSFDYEPNVDGLERLLNHFVPVWERTSTRPYEILICGGKLAEPLQTRLKLCGSRHIHYLGFVADLKQYVQAADIMLNPVVQGGGVKIKVMESLAWGTTVVSTDSGSKGVFSSVCGTKLAIHADDNFIGMVAHVQTLANETWQPTPNVFYETYNTFQIGENVVNFLECLPS